MVDELDAKAKVMDSGGECRVSGQFLVFAAAYRTHATHALFGSFPVMDYVLAGLHGIRGVTGSTGGFTLCCSRA